MMETDPQLSSFNRLYEIFVQNSFLFSCYSQKPNISIDDCKFCILHSENQKKRKFSAGGARSRNKKENMCYLEPECIRKHFRKCKNKLFK